MTILRQLLDPAQAPNVRRLSQRSSQYLQTLVTQFTLTRSDRGLQLRLKIEDDPLTIVDGRGKADLERLSRSSGLAACEQLQQRLDAVLNDPDSMGYRYDSSAWPMRYANGGVLPVVHLEGRDYFLLFYRDIFPIGWNIANGASDEEEEWVDPNRIIHREFAEEVLFADPTQELLYVYEPLVGACRFGFHRDALSAWKPHRPELATYRQVPMPFKWIDGPDSVHIEYGEDVYDHGGFFLSVTPPDHGIEVDRFVLIRLTGDTRLYCGEIADGRPFNHIVGLFDVERLRSLYPGNAFLPDVFFFSGERYDGRDFPTILPDYLNHVRREPPPGLGRLRREDQIQHYEHSEVRFNFCPISRSIIGRYYDWVDAGQSETMPPATPDPDLSRPSGGTGSADGVSRITAVPANREGHEVFLSHASRHVTMARQLFDAVERRIGASVFFSAHTLAQQGESNYRQSIERALGQSRCLVVLLMGPDDLASGWINYEWMTFDSERIAGRKNGRIFTVMNLEHLSIEDLPLGLRQHEVIGLQVSRPLDAFDRLCDFLGPALREGCP